MQRNEQPWRGLRLSLRNVRARAPLFLGISIASAGLAALASVPAQAQDPGMPCPGMMNVVSGPIDASLQLTAEAEVVARNAPTANPSEAPSDVVGFSWQVAAGSAKCIWIQRKDPGGTYSSMADFIFRPDEQPPPTDRPVGVAGEWCYRFFAVSDLGQSQPVESCVEIITPAVLRTDTGVQTPEPAPSETPPPSTPTPDPPAAGSGRATVGAHPVTWQLLTGSVLAATALSALAGMRGVRAG